MTTPIYRPLREAETKERLDVASWPGLDSVRFVLRTIGSGDVIGGPFFFGRAFDLPPFFTFSAVAQTLGIGSGPQLTVGVAEWITDEQGMYVGANLWFQLGHVTPCREWAFFGDQVLVDPGFEGGFVRGPDDGELPTIDLAHNVRWPSTLSSVVESFGPGDLLATRYPWLQHVFVEDESWREETSSVHSGITSASFDFGAMPEDFNTGPHLSPVGSIHCATSGTAKGAFGYRTKPFDKFIFSCWARVSTLVGTPFISMFINSFSPTLALGVGGGPGSDFPLAHVFASTDWEFLTHTIVMIDNLNPIGNPVMGQPTISPRRQSFASPEFDGTMYIDDFELTIEGGTSLDGYRSSPDADFQVNLSFAGQIFKGYSNIHPVRSIEAPTQVVLTR